MSWQETVTTLKLQFQAARQLIDSLRSNTKGATHSNGNGLMQDFILSHVFLEERRSRLLKPSEHMIRVKEWNWTRYHRAMKDIHLDIHLAQPITVPSLKHQGSGPPPGRRGRCNAEQRTPSSPSGPFVEHLHDLDFAECNESCTKVSGLEEQSCPTKLC